MRVNLSYPSSGRRAGGVAVIYEYANALARRGHEVSFLHAPRTESSVASVAEIQFTFDPRVRHFFADSHEDPRLPPADVHFGVGPARLGLPVSFIQGFRLVSHELDRESFRRRLPKVCVAKWLVEVGRAFGVPPIQLTHVPVGLDHEVFSVRRPPDDRPLDVAVLYHPWPAKGWDVAAAVLDELARRRPVLTGVVFSMAGPPPGSLPTGFRVELDLDHRTLADEVLNQTKLFLQTSHHEGLGLTAIEAMACGAALVTTDCGGSRDYAVADQTALVRRAGDVAGLADACALLLDDESLRASIVSAARRLVKELDWDVSAEILEALLERYLADPERFRGAPGEDRSEEYRL